MLSSDWLIKGVLFFFNQFLVFSGIKQICPISEGYLQKIPVLSTGKFMNLLGTNICVQNRQVFSLYRSFLQRFPTFGL